MIKKFLLSLSVVILLVVIYSYYQKTHPAVNKIFNIQNGQNNQPSGIMVSPSGTGQPPAGSSQIIFLQIDQPNNNVTVTSSVIVLSGRTVPNADIFVNEQELKADTNGNFSTNVIIAEGENDITVVASDDLGNSTEKDMIVNLESTQ